MEYITSVLLQDVSYLWMLFFIMISAGLAKEYNLFAPAFAYVRNTFRSNKFVVVLLSAIGGILPIEGRVTVSAGLLDAVAPKIGQGREKFGIVDYLSTHHYYLWSPLEKTVIIPIAVLGLSYGQWLGIIAPLLVVSILFISWYIWFQIHEENVIIAPENFKLSSVIRNSLPMFIAIGCYVYTHDHILCFGLLTLYYAFITQQWNFKKLLGYINWEVIIIVGAVIILGNYFKSNSSYFNDLIENSLLNPKTLSGMTMLSLLGFITSFLLGSSGKFIALAVLLTLTFGQEYFLWFFAVEYAGYLLSPTHKCVMVGNRYFGTPYKTYYSALGAWTLILVTTGGLFTFLI